MNSKGLSKLLAAALMVGAGVAGAADRNAAPATDAALQQRVGHEIRMYPRYTIWDDISYRVHNGQVELFGAVNQPFKKSDIEHIVRDIPGVTSVADEIKVLPLSPTDDRLRLQVARAIYSDPVLSRYGMQAVGPIHVIVENGHVTLTGVVNNEMEKNVAGIRANGAGMSFGNVINNLQVERPGRKS
jgi:hyperosmotically inducible periplasmic protein